MTRRGDRQRPWTTADDRYLVEHAGVDSLRDICRALKRSRSSVEVRASRMHVSLRRYERLTVICPKCGEARAKSGAWTRRTGFCGVCAARDAYEEALWRQSEAFAALPPESQAKYAGTQARTGSSRMPPRPPAPALDLSGGPRAERARELYAIDVEKWELRRLKLLTDAVKKRTQRMREEVGANPRKGACVDFVDAPNE